MSAQEDFFQALMDGRVSMQMLGNRVQKIVVEPPPEPVQGPDTPRIGGPVKVFTQAEKQAAKEAAFKAVQDANRQE